PKLVTSKNEGKRQMNARKLLLALGATTAVGAAGLGVGAALEDPEPSVEPIALSAVQGGQTEQDEPGAAPANRQVAALDEVSGTVTRDDDDDRDDVDDFDDLEIGRVDLDFGPDSWVRTAGPMEDYDGDGTAEDLRAELEGLVGTEARLLVRLDA